MDEFYKPKIVYPETTQGAYFVIDEEGYYLDKTCFILITQMPQYIQSMLSSHLFEVAYKRIFSSIELGQNGYQYNKHALVKLPVKLTNFDRILSNDEIYLMYGLTCDEIEFIQSQYNQ